MKLVKLLALIFAVLMVVWVGLYASFFKVEEFNENKQEYHEKWDEIESCSPLRYVNKPNYREWYALHLRRKILKNKIVHDVFEGVFIPLNLIWRNLDYSKVQ